MYDDCAEMDQDNGYEWVAIRQDFILISSTIQLSSYRCDGGDEGRPLCMRDVTDGSSTTQYPTSTTSGYPTTTDDKYHVELIGGSSKSGNVFATNRNGYFGPVCDDSFGSNEANVVCRYILRKKFAV